ncbi:MAG: 50S ribosomal protein L23 [archaeon]
MIIEYPLLSEKAVNMIEKENKLAFAVSKNATKKQIKEEFEKMYNVKVAEVNTVMGIKGKKKAFIRLKPEFKAMDLATKLKLI